MLLYLTSKDKVDLLDFAEQASGLIPKKMTGRFSLLQFIIRDMRNYAHLKYFVIDRTAAIEDDSGFAEAVSSFLTMYSARVIIICESRGSQDTFLRQLIMLGVTDIVTAAGINEIQAEILECLSPQGMQRYKQPELERPTLAARLVPPETKYVFSCQNIRIAIAGCQRRVGVTTTALNLAYWIHSHGGTACYQENNPNRHMAYILKLYGDQPEGNHYTIGGVDYYFTDVHDKTYNFIITDCGELEETPQTNFTEADLRFLCCSAMPYELSHMQNAIKRCDGIALQILGMYVPLDIRELVQQATGGNMLFAIPSHELFNGNINNSLNKTLLNDYII